MTTEEIAARLRALADEIEAATGEEVTYIVAPAYAKPKPTTIEDVRAALTKLAGAKGGAAVKKLLKAEFGVEKASDLSADQFAAVVELAEKEAL